MFCANDLLALGVLQEMTPPGIGVPDDIAIVGYDDIEFAAAAAVPLTSVRQPRDAAGPGARAELLLEEARRDRRGDAAAHVHRQVVVRRRSSSCGASTPAPPRGPESARP